MVNVTLTAACLWQPYTARQSAPFHPSSTTVSAVSSNKENSLLSDPDVNTDEPKFYLFTFSTGAFVQGEPYRFTPPLFSRLQTVEIPFSFFQEHPISQQSPGSFFLIPLRNLVLPRFLIFLLSPPSTSTSTSFSFQIRSQKHLDSWNRFRRYYKHDLPRN